MEKEKIAEALQKGLYMFAAQQSDRYASVHNLINTLYKLEVVTEDEMNELKHLYYHNLNPF